MAFEIRFKKSVQKDLHRLTRSEKRRILDSTQRDLAADPYRGKALSGEFRGLYRWRIGSHRIIYEIHKDAKAVLVLRIGHRKDVYR